MFLTTSGAIADRNDVVQPLGNLLRQVLENRGLIRQTLLPDSDAALKPEDGYSAPQTTFVEAVPDRPRLVRA